MSSENINSIPSNEELINELTRDLRDSAIKLEDDQLSHGDNGSLGNHSDTESVEAQVGTDPEVRDVDFIDDELLKTKYAELNDEEKRELLQKALGLKSEGNIKFKAEEHEEACKLYTEALQTCPIMFPNHRAILFANRAAAKLNINIESAIQDCTRAIELDPSYLKAYIRRSKLYERNDKLDEALEDLKKVIEVDKYYGEAAYHATILQEKINERNEKLKTEMMSKLKDLGNMVLKPFGLSTQNFQVNQDPNTGGYSINFKQ
ncbi:tetratricopeptide repeat protein 1 [Adelges cooleyi]|uniref:tetratricopeptide repeat protein 1 n=1 Tax=Adelges cooleyi TaxID=133065 RepID=UPI00217F25D2|nr:tetratricopeptide repeat protein 1 [Adelges cooleyi]XP_050435814.1 tetratricopeptide repeat protein 1 [Adelges cooleyi]